MKKILVIVLVLCFAAMASAADTGWNKTDPNALTNGNIHRAVSVLRSSNFTKEDAVNEDAFVVMKTPWNYYGTLLAFSGVVGVVDDYPPGSDVSSILQCDDASEIVITSNDGETIVDMFLRSSSGRIRVGDYVTLYGLVVGRAEVDNRMGGTFSHLIIIGDFVDY